MKTVRASIVSALFTDALSESIAQGGGFGVSSILQQQLTSNQGGKSLEAENKGHNQ